MDRDVEFPCRAIAETRQLFHGLLADWATFLGYKQQSWLRIPCQDCELTRCYVGCHQPRVSLARSEAFISELSHPAEELDHC